MKRTWKIMDFAVPTEQRVNLKDNEVIDEDLNFARVPDVLLAL